jgi:hypothetical protein
MLSQKELYNNRKSAGTCVRHPSRERHGLTVYCTQCHEKSKKVHKNRYNTRKMNGVCYRHPDRKSIGSVYCQECLDDQKNTNANYRIKAMNMVFEAHNVFECHRNIHPNISEDLKQHKCWGQLQFEHPNGGGHKDQKINGKHAVIRGLVSGKRNPKDYLILCQLHQLWNVRPQE